MSGEKLKDIVVVGAGVTGSFIAKELSKFDLDVLVLEKKTCSRFRAD
ncbi:MAG: FAD-dependent oxidoreductase [Archaeoglobaceae archaeon]